jgi:putative Mn2+ efflux pump MntP
MACGVYLLTAAGWKKFQANPRTILFLPALMSLDNFAYGVGIDPLNCSIWQRAIILGTASFSLAMLGLFAGNFIGLPRRCAAEWSAGVALVGAGLMLFFV